jgi:HPt (histidine-containing phosphotransfer) domain-containing protein
MESITIKESKYARSLIEARDVTEHKEKESMHNKKVKFTDLDYLRRRTKSDPVLMMQMILLYLEQTPALISEMKISLMNKDWSMLCSAVHKIIPSFSIMGISKDFESMAKQVQEYAYRQSQTDEIPDMVLKLENVCMQSCIELEEEYKTIKNKNS